MPVETGVSGAAGAGSLEVSGEGGAGLATEATLQDVKTAAEALAGTITGGQPVSNDQKVAVGIATSTTLPVEIVGGQAVSAQPESGAEGIATYPIGLAPAIPVGETDKANPVVVLGTAQIAGEVAQGRGTAPDTADPWIVATSDGAMAQQIATKAGQDATLEAVDDLEEDADATRVAVEELNTKTLTPLGTAPLDPVRGSASNVATQLGSLATPRGFTLDNIDATNDLYWGTGAGVTTANGYKIEPGYGYEFLLPNTDLIWVIAGTTAAYQIGAIS